MSTNQLQTTAESQSAVTRMEPADAGGTAKETQVDPALAMFIFALFLVIVSAVVSIILAIAKDVQAAQRDRAK